MPYNNTTTEEPAPAGVQPATEGVADVDGGGVESAAEEYRGLSGDAVSMRPLIGVWGAPRVVVHDPKYAPWTSVPIALDDPSLPPEMNGKSVYASLNVRSNFSLIRDLAIVFDYRIDGYSMPDNALKKIGKQGFITAYADILPNLEALLKQLVGHRLTCVFGGAVEGIPAAQYPNNYHYSVDLPGKKGKWTRTYTIWGLLAVSPMVRVGEEVVGPAQPQESYHDAEEDDEVPF